MFLFLYLPFLISNYNRTFVDGVVRFIVNIVKLNGEIDVDIGAERKQKIMHTHDVHLTKPERRTSS